MNACRSIGIFFLLCCGLLVVSKPVSIFAQSSADTPKADSPQSAALPDGQHDFDFELGSWKIHLKRRLNPLTGSNKWVELRRHFGDAEGVGWTRPDRGVRDR